MSNCEPPNAMASQQQLLRSKSLNDISSDSQIPAFASDRFIHLHMSNNNNNNDSSSAYISESRDPNQMVYPMGPAAMAPGAAISPTCMPIEAYNYFPTSNMGGGVMNAHNATGSNNSYGNIPFDNSRNISNTQCSRPQVANVFNMCSPLTMNLNGVTEQIGNLHL